MSKMFSITLPVQASFHFHDDDGNFDKKQRQLIRIFCQHDLSFDKDIVIQTLLDLFRKLELKENGWNEHKLVYYFVENTWLDEWYCQLIFKLKHSKWVDWGWGHNAILIFFNKMMFYIKKCM